MFTIEEFVKAVKLTKKADCVDFATLPSLRKTLSCTRLELLEWIDEHPQLIHTEERFHKKHQKIRVRGWGALQGQSWTETRIVDGHSFGLCVIEAFEKEEDNPWTEKGLAKLIKDYEKTIWLSKVDNYGEILGDSIQTDKHPSDIPSGKRYPDARKCPWLWRNTEEKIERLLSDVPLKIKSFWIGGFGDCYERKELAVSSAEADEMRAKGWTVKSASPL